MVLNVVQLVWASHSTVRPCVHRENVIWWWQTLGRYATSPFKAQIRQHASLGGGGVGPLPPPSWKIWENFFTSSSKLIFYRKFIWMISSRLTGVFLQKSILDPPTPLSPSHAVKFWSKFYQISVWMPYEWNMHGVSIGGYSFVPIVCVSINTWIIRILDMF